MLKLTREKIRRLAGNDMIYSKGLRYYKEGKVSKASYSSKTNEYKFIVTGSYDYQVSITDDDDAMEFQCNCPSHSVNSGACKHVIAALLFLNRLIQKSESTENMPPEDKRAYQILEYMSNQVEIDLDYELLHLEVAINIPAILKDETTKAELNLRIGSNRLYKIQSLRRFFNCYHSYEKMFFGKECRFVRGENKFDRKSQRIFDYLYELYLIQYKCFQDSPLQASDYMGTVFTKTGMLLTQQSLVHLLEILDGDPIKLSLYNRREESVVYKAGNPSIRYDIDYIDDAITFNYHRRHPVFSLAGDGSLLYYEGTLYSPDEVFSKYYLPFYNSLGAGKPPLVFRGNNRQRFLEEMLPVLHDTMDVPIPEFLSDKYIMLPFSADVYLEPYQGTGIKAIVKFKYGEYEFNSNEQPDIGSNILVREKEKESQLIKFLYKLGFSPNSDGYVLINDKSIYDFLNEGITELSELCTIFYAKEFGRLKIRRRNKMNFSMRAGEKIDLLEVSLSIEDVDRDELLSIIKAYQIKKEFIRLKDGSFFALKENQELQTVSDFLDDLNIPLVEVANETIKLTKKDVFYLDSLSKKLESDYEISFEKDNICKRLIETISTCETEPYDLPKGITADIRPYQLTGYRWLRTLADNHLGGILADEMGLGKTLQSILYIAGVLEQVTEEKKQFLIVCPTSLIYNWLDELATFTPWITGAPIVGAPAERSKIIRHSEADVLITSYPLLRNDLQYYKSKFFDTVLIDEAQSIKNFASLNAKAVKQIKCNHRFALTGTPIENGLSELWSVFDFLMPGFLSTHTKFVREYEFPIAKGNRIKLEELNKRIESFILRRLKKDVLTELPDKIEEKLIVDMTDEQTKVYLSYMENLRTDLHHEISQYGIEKSGFRIMAALTRLRQICCYPGIFLENYNGGSGKLLVLMNVLREAITNGHRILIFSQFTSLLAVLKKELDSAGYSYFYLDGNTEIAERTELVKSFNKGEREMFLISLKAGGTGLNLTGADMVIHYDPWWNPAVEEQAEDRAHRIGQLKNVHVLKLITRGTIEEKIYKMQKQKKKLSDSIVRAQENFITSLSLEEIEDLFR